MAKMQAGRPSRNKEAATLNVFDDRGKLVRVNFELTREEHTRLKVYAARSGRTISDVLREFVATLKE